MSSTSSSPPAGDNDDSNDNLLSLKIIRSSDGKKVEVRKGKTKRKGGWVRTENPNTIMIVVIIELHCIAAANATATASSLAVVSPGL